MYRPLLSQPTEYHGRIYRSATEARWAYFFDLMRLTVEYESDGFELINGRYLPDFYIPCQRARGVNSTWVEVKGREPTPEEKAKLKEVCVAFSCAGLILIGMPRANNLLLYFDPNEQQITADGWREASQTLLYRLIGANEGTFKAVWFSSSNEFFSPVYFMPPRKGEHFVNIRDVDELKRNAEALSACKERLTTTRIWLGVSLVACAVLLLNLLLK